MLEVRAVSRHFGGVAAVDEASIAVVVASPHRAAAFDACRAIVEAVKADVPIFKRELWDDGRGSWVDGL